MAYGNNRGNYNRQEQIQLNKIELDFTKNEQLFGKIAEDWSKQLENESKKPNGKENGKNKINQIRSFYDKVIELQEKSEGMSDDKYKQEIFPFVVMLKSKVAYAKTRGLVSDTFVNMINQCVDEATTVAKMQNFKLFFEAVIGFYPKK